MMLKPLDELIVESVSAEVVRAAEATMVEVAAELLRRGHTIGYIDQAMQEIRRKTDDALADLDVRMDNVLQAARAERRRDPTLPPWPSVIPFRKSASD
jgi:hypothetical protein